MDNVTTKPYLIRAIWEWCIDQGFTPYLAVHVDANTRVPPGYAHDDQIVLNLSPDATGQLQMNNDFITFQARFGGIAHSLVIPVDNVLAIYARENGQGMGFDHLAGAEAGAEVQPEITDGGAEGGADGADGEGAEAGLARAGDGSGGTLRPARGGHLKIVK